MQVLPGNPTRERRQGRVHAQPEYLLAAGRGGDPHRRAKHGSNQHCRQHNRDVCGPRRTLRRKKDSRCSGSRGNGREQEVSQGPGNGRRGLPQACQERHAVPRVPGATVGAIRISGPCRGRSSASCLDQWKCGPTRRRSPIPNTSPRSTPTPSSLPRRRVRISLLS